MSTFFRAALTSMKTAQHSKPVDPSSPTSARALATVVAIMLNHGEEETALPYTSILFGLAILKHRFHLVCWK